MGRLRSYSRHPFVWIVLLPFLAAVLFVSPRHEVAVEDDWAYARTAQHLYQTGEYRLDDWASANLPLQAYWGVLLSHLFGFSFSTLRLSTLILFSVPASSSCRRRKFSFALRFG